MVPPAAPTIVAALAGIWPPANDTRYVELATSALADSGIAGVSRSAPQAASEVDRQTESTRLKRERSLVCMRASKNCKVQHGTPGPCLDLRQSAAGGSLRDSARRWRAPR